MRKLTFSLTAVTLSTLLATSQASAAEKWIRVVNDRAVFPVFYVYITPAGQRTWGDDQLGGQTIAAGHSSTWTIPWSGCRVDVKAVTFTGLSTEARNVNACGGLTWTVYDN